jgi:hypothetical protein
LRFGGFPSTDRRVEDWEQHFIEKSRRRSQMDRDDRNQAIFKGALAAAIIAAVVLGGIVALSVFA